MVTVVDRHELVFGVVSYRFIAVEVVLDKDFVMIAIKIVNSENLLV